MRSGYDRIGFTITVEQATRQCPDKRRYNSRNAARDRAARMRHDHPENAPQSPYRCTVCGDWHLTSKPKKRRDKRGARP